MKIKLTSNDLTRNSDRINRFLSKREMSQITGGQGTADAVPENGIYTNHIYPNYSQSTYVNKYPYVNYIAGHDLP